MKSLWFILLLSQIHQASARISNGVFLSNAVLKGDVERVAVILNEGVNPNDHRAGEMSPLGWAAYKGNKEAFDLLLSKGADPCYINERGETILYNLVQGSNHGSIAEDTDIRLEMIKTLIKRQVPIDSPTHTDKDKFHGGNETPLIMAAFRCHPEFAEILLSAGANPAHKNGDGKNALQQTLCVGYELQEMKAVFEKYTKKN